MKIYEATEIAYKNGYEQGKKDAVKWIPVTERLPEEEGLYLVAVVNDHERRYSKTAWYHGHGNWFLHQKVTHWMPLPEPPKGGGAIVV